MKSITFLEMMPLARLFKETFIVGNSDNFKNITMKKMKLFSRALAMPFHFDMLDQDFSLKEKSYTIWIKDHKFGEIELDMRTISLDHATDLMRYFLNEAYTADGGCYRGLNIDYAYDLQVLRAPISSIELQYHILSPDTTKASLRQAIYNCADFNSVLLKPEDFWRWYEDKFMKYGGDNSKLDHEDMRVANESIENILNVYPHDWVKI